MNLKQSFITLRNKWKTNNQKILHFNKKSIPSID